MITTRVPAAGRPWVMALAFLPAALGGFAACGDEGATPGDTADAEAEVLEPLPELALAIEATRLTGNAPLTVTFTARPTGAAVADLTIRWTVDGAAVGEGEALEFTFFRAGSATVKAVATYVRAADQASVSQDATAIVTVRACADLRFDRFTVDAPTDVPPGGALRVRVATLYNDGDAVEDPFSVALVLSSDADLDLDNDVVVAGPTFPSMTSGLASDSTIDLAGQAFVLPSDLPEGDYFAFLVADPGAAVNECQEANNHEASTNNVRVDLDAGKLPNLVMPAITIPSGLVLSQGELLNYGFQLQNVGEADAKQFRHAFWLSTDTTLSPETDRVIAAATDESSRVQTMTAGFALGFFKSWKVPDDLPDGDYYIVGKVDATDVVGESDEGDNVAVSAASFTMRRTIPVCADLGLARLVVTPLSSYWGGTVLLQVTVANAGSQPVPEGWLFRAYLSLQPTLNFVNAFVVDTWPLGAVPAGGEETFDILLPVSDELPVVPHYVAGFADPTGALSECDETNNARVFGEPLKIAASASVDVDVTSFDYHPDVVQAGDVIKVEYTLENHGTSAATAFQVGVVLSADASVSRAGIAAGQDIVVDRFTVPSLGPEQATTLVRDVVVPTGLDHAVSQYTVAVIADLDGFLVSDTNAANNTRVSPDPLSVTGAAGGCFEDALEDDDTRNDATTVGPEAGVVTTGLGSCGDADWFQVTVQKGESLIVDVDARPITAFPAVASDLVVELYDPAGQLVQRANLGPRYEVRAYAVPSVGTWAVRVMGASTAARAAYDLAVSIAPPVVGVDLVAFDVRPLPSTSYPGGRLAVAWREVDLGTIAAGLRVTRIWLSKDRALDATDLALGELAQAPLAAQATAGRDATVGVPASVPGGSWHVLVEVDADADVGEVDEGNNVAVGGPIVLDPLKVCNDDAREPNDEQAIASVLAPAEVVDAVVCPGLPDWYAVDLEEGESLVVDVDYAYDPSKGKLVLELWDPSGQAALATHTRDAALRVSLPSAWRAGRWLVRVANEAGGLSAPYAFTVTATVAPAPLAQRCVGDRYEDDNAPLSAVGLGCGMVAATLCNLDVDWYVIQGTAGRKLDIVMTHSKSELYPKLYLPASFTSAVAQLWGGNGTLSYTPGSDGPVFLKIEPRSGPTSMTAFDYTVRVVGLDGVDLALESLASDFAAVARGEDAGLEVGVENQCGADAGAFEVGAFLSIDDALGVDDVALGAWPVPGLAAQASTLLAPKITVPLSTLPGLYWLVVQADAGLAVPEGNELDNVLAVPLEVREPCVADALEPNDGRGAAEALTAPIDVPGLTICPYDLDWFALPVAAGATVSIDLLFEHAVGDLDVRVYAGADVFPVAVGQSTDDDEHLVVDVPLATTLYVRVAGHGPASAPYDLVIDVAP